jgi:sporulation protein YlmC with PRC-barrel domain
MLAKYTIAGLAGSALLATAAFAQTPAATTTLDRAGMAPSNSSDPNAAKISSSLQKGWATSKLVGLAVYNNNDESLGSINDLLTDKSGNIQAVVIGVGGLLGVGAHLVAVPFDKVTFVSERISYTAASGSPNAEGNRPASTVTTGANTAPATTSKSAPGDPDHAVFNATKDELKAMPEFKYSM